MGNCHNVRDNTIVRPMMCTDLEVVVNVHEIAFEGFFLERMGRPFLRQYYEAILDYYGSIALVSESKDGVVAFAVGFLDPAGFYSLLRSRRIRMLPSILFGLIRQPSLIGEVLGNARRVESGEIVHQCTVELSSLGVAVRGKGVGSLLLEVFCQSSFSKGARSVVLFTDAEGNEAVCRFYEARGFTKRGVERRGERLLCRYELTANISTVGEGASGDPSTSIF